MIEVVYVIVSGVEVVLDWFVGVFIWFDDCEVGVVVLFCFD